jgi:hypothetical protein
MGFFNIAENGIAGEFIAVVALTIAHNVNLAYCFAFTG